MFRPAFLLVVLLLASMAIANPMRPDPTTSTTTTRSSSTVAPKPVAPKPPKVPRLDNILVIGELRKAYFDNGNEASVGTTINGYTVVQIETDFVVLQRGNAQRTLELKTPGEFSVSSAKEE